MKLVNQPSALPTNKLAVSVMIGPVVTELWPEVMMDVYPPLAGGDATAVFVGAIAALIVGYFVPDRANVG
ncbi:hypothetical protein AB3Y40_06860 [Yoonia sp. R2331]|uniref:hypothetical protein n=1 Tax=Yoonia sp. R2331 TaxID=3237238 RepID=UPI0034E3CF2C